MNLLYTKLYHQDYTYALLLGAFDDHVTMQKHIILPECIRCPLENYSQKVQTVQNFECLWTSGVLLLLLYTVLESEVLNSFQLKITNNDFHCMVKKKVLIIKCTMHNVRRQLTHAKFFLL